MLDCYYTSWFWLDKLISVGFGKILTMSSDLQCHKNVRLLQKSIWYDFSFSELQGDRGEKGDQGPLGPVGPRVRWLVNWRDHVFWHTRQTSTNLFIYVLKGSSWLVRKERRAWYIWCTGKVLRQLWMKPNIGTDYVHCWWILICVFVRGKVNSWIVKGKVGIFYAASEIHLEQ